MSATANVTNGHDEMTKTAKASKDTAKWLTGLRARVADDKLRAANKRLAFYAAWQAKFGKPYPEV